MLRSFTVSTIRPLSHRLTARFLARLFFLGSILFLALAFNAKAANEPPRKPGSPAAVSVASVAIATADGFYNATDVIDITVTFTLSVNVNTAGGTPTLALNSGGTATYLSGDNTTALTFRYTVAGGHNSTDLDYTATNSLALNGGTIRNGGDDATLTLPAVGTLAAAHAVVVDTNTPTVSSVVRQSPTTTKTNLTSVTFRVTFNEPITTASVAEGDFLPVFTGGLTGSIAGGGAVAVSPSGGFTTQYDVTVSSLANVGTVNLTVPVAATIDDRAGNDFATLFNTGEIYTREVTAPTVLSSNRQGGTNPTAATSVVFRVTFDEAMTVSTFDNSDFTPTFTSTANGSVSGVSAVTPSNGLATAFDVTVGSLVGDGTVRLDVLGAASLNDEAGNDITATFNTGETFTLDHTGPTSTASYTTTRLKNGTAQTITITFGELVTGTPKITVTGPAGTIVNNQDMTIGADASIWTYAAGTTWTGDGNATVTVGTATDALLNVVNANPTNNTFVVDNTGPTSAGTYTKSFVKNGDNQTVTLTFNENLTVAPKITVTGPAGTIINDQTMAGSNNVWTYGPTTVWTGNGTATVTVGTGTDVAGNVVQSPPATNTFTVDNDQPTSAATYTTSNIKNGSNQTITLTFNEALTVTPKITVTAPAGTVINDQDMSGGPTVWTYGPTSVWTGDGTATVTVGTGTDAAGNVVTTNPSNNTFTVDNTPPTIAIGAPSLAATNTGPVTFAVTYTGATASTLAVGDVTINSTGTASATKGVSSVTAAGGTVTLSSITGDGTLGVTIAAGTASDAAGNLAAGISSLTFNVDNTGPTSTATYTTTTLKNGDAQTITLTFNQLVTGTPKITVTGPSGTIINNQDMTIGADASVWTYGPTTTWTGNGTATVTVGTATDAVGNVVNSTPASNTFTIDNNGPTSTASYTTTTLKNGTNQTITLTFNENLTVTPRITVTGPAGTIINDQLMTGATNVWTYGPTAVWTGDGTATVTVGTGTDLAGNLVVSPPANNTFTVDNTAPTAAITYSDADGYFRNGQGAVTITATFSEPILDAPVVQLAVTGTNTLAAGNMTKTSTTVYTRSFTPSTGNGSCSVAMSVGTDAAGNVVTATPSSGGTFIIDNLAPSAVTINQAAAQADPHYGNAVNFTVVFTNGPVTAGSFTAADVVVSGGTQDDYTVGSFSTSDNGTTWNIVATVTPGTDLEGTMIPSISGTFTDLAGNTSGSLSSTSTDNTVEVITEPTVSPTSLTPSAVTANTMTLTATGNLTAAERFVLVARAGAAVTFTPVDGVDYNGALNFFNQAAEDGDGNKILADGIETAWDVTGLSGGVTYHFAVFPYNRGSQTTYNNFRTTATTASQLTTACSYPTAPVTGVHTSNTTQIVLNWTRTADTDRTLILMRADDGTAITLPVNGMDLSSIDNASFTNGSNNYGNAKVMLADETHATNLTQTRTISNLTPGTTYAFAIYTYNSTTFCYQPTAILGTKATTTSTNAELTVLAGALTEPNTISSLGTALSGAVLPQTNAVANFDFIVRDADGDNGAVTGSDSDGANGLISQIVITQGSNNNAALADWTQAISAAQLSDGTNTLTGTVNAANITFSSIPNGAGQLGRVDDDNQKTYTLTIALRTALLGSLPTTIDEKQFDFQILTAGITASGAGSTVAAAQSQSSGLNKNVVAVVASQIVVATQPTLNPIADVVLAQQPIFHVRDQNNNRDLGADGSLTIATSNPDDLGHSGGISTFTDGVADFTGSGLKFANASTNSLDPTASTMSVSITSPSALSVNTSLITVSANTTLTAASSVTLTNLFNNDVQKSVLAFSLQSTGSTIELNSVTFTVPIGSVSGYVKNLTLYSGATDNFAAATIVSGPQSSLTFSGLSGSSVQYTSTPTYFFLAVDVESGFPTASPTIQFRVAETGLTLSKGLKNTTTVTGTNYSLIDNIAPFFQDINNIDSYLNAWNGFNNVATPAYHSDQVAFLVTFSEPVSNVNTNKFNTAASSTVNPGMPNVNSNYNIAALQPTDVTGTTVTSSPSRYWRLTYNILNDATGFIYPMYCNTCSGGGIVQDAAGNNETTTAFVDGFPGDYFFYLAFPKPTNDPLLSTSSSTTSSISITLNHNNGLQRATDYYIRAKRSTIPSFPGSTDAVNGTLPLDDTNDSDGIVNMKVTNSSFATGAPVLESYTFFNLKSGVSYDFEVYPYTYSDNIGFDNASEFKNDTPLSFTRSTTTASSSRLVFVSTTPLASTVDDNPGGQSQTVFQFMIQDDQDNLAADDAPFKFSAITFSQGTGNGVPVWTDVIAGALLSDGSTDITGTVGANTISFTGITSASSGNFGYIDDNQNKTYSLKLWLREDLLGTYESNIDLLNLAFSVTLVPANYNDGNNQLTSRLGVTNTALGVVDIDVDATKILFQTPGSSPTNTNPQIVSGSIGVRTPFSSSSEQDPGVYALDANNNRDWDYNEEATIGNTGTLGQFYNLKDFVSGFLDLNDFYFTTAGVNTQLQVSALGVGSVNSSNVTAVVTNTTTIEASTTLTEPSTISSLGTALTGAVAPQQNAVSNFDFRITDDKVANITTYSDNDGLPTTFDQITISQGTGNDATALADWTDAIAGAELILTSRNGVVTSTAVNSAVNTAINATSIVFSSIANGSGMPGRVNDGEYNQYTLRIYLKNPVDLAIRDLIDNADFVFSVSNTSFNLTAANTSSTLTASNTNSGDGFNAVKVTATKLNFTRQPNATQQYDAIVSPFPKVRAQDANGNLDKGYTGTPVLTTVPNGLITYPVLAQSDDLTNTGGIITFDSLTSDLDAVALTVTSLGGGTNGNSTQFVVTGGLNDLGGSVTPATSNSFVLNYSGASDIARETTFTYPTNILYSTASNQVSDITATTGTAMERFKIRDGGGTTDADGTATSMASVSIRVTNYQYIRQIAIYEVGAFPAFASNTERAEKAGSAWLSAVGNTAVYQFTGITNFSAPDGGENNFVVKVSFIDNPVVDNEVLTFEVIGVAAGGVSSSFVTATPTGTISVPVSDENKIEVVADRLDFTTPAAARFVSINADYVPVVEARDPNANVDADFTAGSSTISALTNTAGASMTSTPAVVGSNFINGVFTFPSDFKFTTGDNNADVTLSMTAGSSPISTSSGITPALTLKTNTINSATGIETLQISSIPAAAPGVFVFDFRIADDDNQVAGTDVLPTRISQIVISQAAGNDIADWTELIQSATLETGPQSMTVTPNATNITFSGIANSVVGDFGYISDDANRFYTLKIVLKNALGGSLPATVDNLNLVFEVLASGVTTLAATTTSSTFGTVAASAAFREDSGAGNNAIDVDITHLSFTQDIVGDVSHQDLLTDKNIGSQQAVPVIKALDDQNNTDLDYDAQLSIYPYYAPAITFNTATLNTDNPAPNAGVYTFPAGFQYTKSGLGRLYVSDNVSYDVSSLDVDVRGGAAAIVSGGSGNTTPVSSLTNTLGAATTVFTFTVEDDPGGTPANENDGSPTRVDEIVISAATATNTITNWDEAIAGATLTDDETIPNTISVTSITANQLKFSTAGLNNLDEIGHIDEAGTKTYTLKIWLYDTLPGSQLYHQNIDGLKFAFEVQSVNQTSVAIGDGSASTFRTSSPSTAGSSLNEVTVVATHIAFPSVDVGASASNAIDISPNVVAEAWDANGNRDRSYDGAVTFPTPVSGNANTSDFLTTNRPAGPFVDGVLNYPSNFQFLSGNGTTRLTIAGGVSNGAGPLTGLSRNIAVVSSFESIIYGDYWSYFTNYDINYEDFQAANITNPGTDGYILDVFELRDGNFSNDADGAPTVLDDLTLGITNPDAIRKIALYTFNGTAWVEVQELARGNFTGVANNYGEVPFTNLNIVAADNQTTLIRVVATFDNTAVNIVDNAPIQISILSATNGVGSQFPDVINGNTTIGGVGIGYVNFGNVPPNTIQHGAVGAYQSIEVLATSLDFIPQALASPYAGIYEPLGAVDLQTGLPTTVGSSVYARDRYGLIDRDFTYYAFNGDVQISPSVPGGALVSHNHDFFEGELHLSTIPASPPTVPAEIPGVQYTTVGNGKLRIQAGGLDSDAPLDNAFGNSKAGPAVNVINVSVVRNDNAVANPNIKGGTLNAVIFGATFSPDHNTTAEPSLKKFTITFDVPFKTPLEEIFKDFKVYVSTDGAYAGSTQIDPSKVTTASSASNGEFDLVVVDLSAAPIPLYSGSSAAPKSFFLVANVAVTANIGTPKLTPQILDFGYNDATDNNIILTKGTATAFVVGQEYSFASTRPPLLVANECEPFGGQMNVDPATTQIKLKFDVEVWSLDGKAELWDRTANVKVADLVAVAGSGRNVPFSGATATANPVVFDIVFLPTKSFQPNGVYYVTIAKGSFDAQNNSGAGISDSGFNFYGGISSNSTFYFKISNPNPPVLSDASGYFANLSTGTFRTTFDQRGNGYFLVLAQNSPAPTKAQIMDYTLYPTPANVVIADTFAITQINAPQTIVFSANLSDGVTYDVWICAENDALPTPVQSAGPYYHNGTTFVASPTPTSPTLTITASASNYNNIPDYKLCPDSYVTLTEPIILGEIGPFDYAIGSQDFYLLLPTGFQFDIDADPAIELIGDDFTDGPYFEFVNNTILRIIYTNDGNSGSLDNIVISNLRIKGDRTAAPGDITRFAGNASLNDFKFADISIFPVDLQKFTNSYTEDNDFTPFGFAQEAVITAIPDNYVDDDTSIPGGIRLIPKIEPANDYGASFFSGNGVTNDVLTLGAVALNAPFDITMTHTDLNGCISNSTEQYVVYDHRSPISNKLGLAEGGTKQALVNTNFPAPASAYVSPTIDFNELAGYNLVRLFATLPENTSNQIMRDTAWAAAVTQIPVEVRFDGTPDNLDRPFLSPSAPLDSMTMTRAYRKFRWDYNRILNAYSERPWGGILADPYDNFRDTTARNTIFWKGGSLGKVEFTGWFQSTADLTVEVPFRQQVEFYVPPIPKLELDEGNQPVKGVAIYCEQGGAIIVNGYPAASAGTSTGTFAIYNAATYNPNGPNTALRNPAPNSAFVDNGNGTATIYPVFDDPATPAVDDIGVKNNFNNIIVAYTYKDNDSPISGTGTIQIRITPNPIAIYTPPTVLCEDVPVAFNGAASNFGTAPGFANAQIAKYTWNFGDAQNSFGNNKNIASGIDTVHTFLNSANYITTLQVTSIYGCVSTVTTRSIGIGGTPVSDFSFTGVHTSDNFEFSNTSTLTSAPGVVDGFSQFVWDFGNTTKTVNTQANESNTYATARVDTVSLTATSLKGCVDRKERPIIVVPRVTAEYQQNFEAGTGGWQAFTYRTGDEQLPPNFPPALAKAHSWTRGSVNKAQMKMDPADANSDGVSDLNGNFVVSTSRPLPATANTAASNSVVLLEKSALYTPSFNINAFSRPMISFNSFVDFVAGDGVILQYSVDNKNCADSSKVWTVLGRQIPEGVDWFNAQNVAASPGAQANFNFGWSEEAPAVNAKWKESKHAFEEALTPAQRANVVFRFAVASAAIPNAATMDGFALDNFRLGERTRYVLFENFTNLGNSAGATVEKLQNDSLRIGYPQKNNNSIVRINYHVGFPNADPFNDDNKQDPGARALYYNISATPRARMDGWTRPNDPLFTTWGVEEYSKQSLKLADAEITPVVTENADGTVSIDITVRALKTLPANTILNIAVVEQNIGLSALSQLQQAMVKTNETVFDFVVKKLLPSPSGTRFGTDLPILTTRAFPTIEWSEGLKRIYLPDDDLSLVIFLQNEDSKEVYQTLIMNMNDPNIILGTEDPNGTSAMHVYPNPGDKEMTIELPEPVNNKTELHMYDQMGKTVELSFFEKGDRKRVVNTSDFAAGVYLIQINTEKGILRRKVMVLHEN